MTKRCLIMAGGTGGHVFPGLAVADALKAKGWDIQWLGTAERMEAKVVPAHGYPIHFIPVRGLRGKGASARLAGIFALLKAMLNARRLIKKLNPDVVLGMGGYASGPGGVAAWSAGIPLVIHEQNAAAGLTNRLLGRLARKILLGFDDAKLAFAYSRERVETVGNPVRTPITEVSEKAEMAAPLNMLVVGGSLGAQALNTTVPAVCGRFKQLNIRHQCGEGNVPAVEKAYEEAKGNVTVTEFIEDMAEAYEWADFIVCRAGALTVSEVAAAGRAAIFVPLPHAVDDHQTRNALSLVKHSAAVMIAQTALEQNLGSAVRHWIDDPAACQKMGELARKRANTRATEMVVNQCETLAGGEA